MNIPKSARLRRTSLALSCVGCLLTAGTTDAAQARILTDFSNDSLALEWISVNDSVMGGISDGSFRISDSDTVVFSGNLSLKNRGGFASIRTRPTSLNLSGFDTIEVRFKGDGRDYEFNLRTPKTRSASAWRATLPTVDGVWQEISIPIQDFEYTMFGRRIPTKRPLNAGDIASIGVILADKKAGPFRLEIDWVRATRAADPQSETDSDLPDLIETAIGAGSFKTLVAALKAADLVEALQSDGPFTVFAPSDDAFSKLPPGTVKMLLAPENRDQLIAILSYHVVPGRIHLSHQSLDTLNGAPLDIKGSGDVSINDARVVATDIETSNGIIHIIDTVLMPEQPTQTPQAAVRSVIALAIERGVPLFNAGQASACAAIYEVALDSIARAHLDALGDGEQTRLRKALHEARNASEHPVDQAWTLRHALNDIDASLAAN